MFHMGSLVMTGKGKDLDVDPYVKQLVSVLIQFQVRTVARRVGSVGQRSALPVVAGQLCGVGLVGLG